MIWDETFPENCQVEENSAVSQPFGQVCVMDEATFQAFYQSMARPLRSYILRVCRDPTLTDDFLQESFYRFLRAPSLRKDESRWKAYLYQIATHLITDHWRQSKRAPGRAPKTGPDENGENVFFVENKENGVILSCDLRRIFQGLKPLERELLWLAYVEGAEHREIAGILRLKEKSVRVLLFRARQKLARILRKRGLGVELK